MITITRHTLAGDGTFGDLAWNGQFLCHTCELTEKEIPAGEYELVPYESPAHGPTVCFHNPELGIYATPDRIPVGVHGRSCIELHAANWPGQLLGCIAPGLEILEVPPNGWGVTQSRIAFSKLVALWGDRTGLTAKIQESYA